MAELNAARALLSVAAPPPVTEVDCDGTRWRWAEVSTPVEAEWRVDPRAADRRARAWGLSWGSFLVLAAVLSSMIGARSTPNDALPLWSPALAVTGAVAVVIGLRAHQRLTRR
jgi:hypothetical protein